VQTQGSLQQADLATLLQTMQSERATGTLTIENGSDSCALYFLFGHLFHAAGPGGEGEEVVIGALGWKSGSYHFDPRAKLPAEETIKASPAELIAAADHPAEAQVAASPSWGDAAGAATSTGGDTGGSPAEAEASPAAPESAAWTPAPIQPAAAAVSPWGSIPAASSSPTSPAAEADPRSPSPLTVASDSTPTYTPAEYTPSYVPASTTPTTPTAASAAAPASRDSGTPSGSATVVPVGSLPIPDGSPQYEGLKSAFVDFPRLLRTLRTDGHTGYIRLMTGHSTGVLLFRDGELVEAEAGPDGASHGEEAFQIFRRDMDTGQGVIDVIDLDADTVTSLARLLTGPPLFTGLLGRFINFEALLEYLSEEKLDGSVVVLGGSETGVILLRQGSILAAYSAKAPKPLTDGDAVAALAGERPARIEVRGSDASRTAIDTEAALSRPY
jgi:hypothetical protein